VPPVRILGLFPAEPVERFPSEVPILIHRAFEMPESNGSTMMSLTR
jgi:hypothetical protein